MTPSTPDPHRSDELDDLVAAYAVDAAEPDDALLVEPALAADEATSDREQYLRHAGGEYAAAVLPAADVPAALRDRVLGAALARRSGAGLTPTTAVELHRLETERALLLLERLRGTQWEAPVDPPELAGWTVRDLVIHLLSNESLLARQLGVTDPLAPETDLLNEPRTAATAARYDGVATEEAVAEYRRFVDAVDAQVSTMTDDELAADIDWWGSAMRASTALIVRTFETWTHADDIRRALGLPAVTPTAPDLACMSIRSLDWVPLMLAFSGREIAPAVATLVLTGAGGGTHTVQLGLDPAPSDAVPVFELTVDIVDYCRAIAARVGPGGLPHRATGDTDLAELLVANLSTLATV